MPTYVFNKCLLTIVFTWQSSCIYKIYLFEVHDIMKYVRTLESGNGISSRSISKYVTGTSNCFVRHSKQKVQQSIDTFSHELLTLFEGTQRENKDN